MFQIFRVCMQPKQGYDKHPSEHICGVPFALFSLSWDGTSNILKFMLANVSVAACLAKHELAD